MDIITIIRVCPCYKAHLMNYSNATNYNEKLSFDRKFMKQTLSIDKLAEKNILTSFYGLTDITEKVLD